MYCSQDLDAAASGMETKEELNQKYRSCFRGYFIPDSILWPRNVLPVVSDTDLGLDRIMFYL